jgi:hypothetical protein
MILPDFRGDQHLSNDLLIRLLDDELTGEETGFVENHLTGCGYCRERFGALRQVSNHFDSFISSLHPAHSLWERQQLEQALDRIEDKTQTAGWHGKTKQAIWGLAAIAAAVALSVTMLSYGRKARHPASAGSRIFQTASAFEVNGETFVALPYSNPDLPLSAPHVVQMQVPLSSLAEAGIYLEPLGSRVSTPDRAVLADVLLGLDGEPLGVHVLSSN